MREVAKRGKRKDFEKKGRGKEDLGAKSIPKSPPPHFFPKPDYNDFQKMCQVPQNRLLRMYLDRKFWAVL